LANSQETNPGEVGGEGRDYIVNDIVPDVLQRGDDQFSIPGFCWGSLAPAYCEGRGALHVHFRVASAKRPVARNYCAAFNRAPLNFDVRGAPWVGRVEVDGCRDGERYVRQSVFISVGELAEGRKTYAVPSIVRLQVLDDCLRGWVDAPDHVSAFVRELLHTTEEGESRLTGNFAGQAAPVVRESEFVGEVVEGGTEVVEAVAYDEPELSGRLLKDFGPDEILAALRVELGPKLVRAFFDPSTDLGFQALQVVERSPQPKFVVEGLASHD
jgi:hypothetical protein